MSRFPRWGHRSRPAETLVWWVLLAGAIAFTAFAHVTTPQQAVRAGKPLADYP